MDRLFMWEMSQMRPPILLRPAGVVAGGKVRESRSRGFIAGLRDWRTGSGARRGVRRLLSGPRSGSHPPVGGGNRFADGIPPSRVRAER